jgi:hypothetical protein
MATVKVRGVLEVPFEIDSFVEIVELSGVKPHGNEVYLGMTGKVRRYTLRVAASGLYELLAFVVLEFSSPASNLVATVPIRFLRQAKA